MTAPGISISGSARALTTLCPDRGAPRAGRVRLQWRRGDGGLIDVPATTTQSAPASTPSTAATTASGCGVTLADGAGAARREQRRHSEPHPRSHPLQLHLERQRSPRDRRGPGSRRAGRVRGAERQAAERTDDAQGRNGVGVPARVRRSGVGVWQRPPGERSRAPRCRPVCRQPRHRRDAACGPQIADRDGLEVARYLPGHWPRRRWADRSWHAAGAVDV